MHLLCANFCSDLKNSCPGNFITYIYYIFIEIKNIFDGILFTNSVGAEVEIVDIEETKSDEQVATDKVGHEHCRRTGSVYLSPLYLEIKRFADFF